MARAIGAILAVGCAAETFPHYVGPVQANGMSFDCGVSGEGGQNGDVFFLHGNSQYRKEGFYDWMRYMNDHGFRTVACDLRGHSPGASPQNYEAYNYNELATDVFALADATGFNRFHVVAHDQGARMMWHSIAASDGRWRFLSVTSLSVPHTDVYSEAVFGPSANSQLQAAFQYMNVFTMNTAESLQWSCDLIRRVQEPNLDNDLCQRRVWWYNGGVDSGNLALPPRGGYAPELPPNLKYGDDGVPSTTAVKHVHMPVLFVLGGSEYMAQGNFPFASRHKELCEGAYTHLEALSCGHDLMICTKTQDAVCDGSACGLHDGSGNKILDAIMGNIALASQFIV